MAIGAAIKRARLENDFTQDETARAIGVERTTLSKYENGKLNLPKDLRVPICEYLDDALLTIEMYSEATNGASIPYLDGPMVDTHHASLINRAIRELREAKQHLKEFDTEKPIHLMTDYEIRYTRKSMWECLDVAAIMLTLVANKCKWVEASFQDEMKEWRKHLQQEQLIK